MAYVTFEDEDAQNRALHLDADKKHEFLHTKFTPAPEPSEIVWENQELSWKQLRCRELVAYLFVGVFLALSFYTMYWMSTKQMKLTAQFPVVDCVDIQETYGDELKQYAIFDYAYIEKNPNSESNGCLQCFCDQQSEILGKDTVRDMEFGPAGQKEPICDVFYSKTGWAKIL